MRLATRMALAARLADNEVKLIDGLSFSEPKTKEMAGIVKALKLDGKRLLVALEGYDPNVYKSVRNLADVSVLPVAEINALEVLLPRVVLMTRAAMDSFRQKAGVRRENEPTRRPPRLSRRQRATPSQRATPCR